jgi:hypothetical protein
MLSSICRVAMMVSLAAASAPSVSAIVMRHDRAEALYLERARAYPSTASLRRAQRPGAPGDTGTLVAPQWVLTVAHVASGLAAGDIAAFADVANRIDLVVLHPEWKSNADIRVDIALLKLETPVKGIAPVALYRRNDEAGAVATFVGRGGNGTGLTGPTAEDRRLRAATNRIERADRSLLVFRFDAPTDPGVTELEGISGPGDSGGPAYVDVDGLRYVVGVSSSQDSRPANRRVGHYGVLEYYSRVSFFAEWLEEVMRTRG